MFSTFPRRAFSSMYKPLKEYQGALNALQSAFSQQQRAEVENALKLYTSRADTSQFSQEEMKQVFPALFVIGKAHIYYSDDFNEAFKWFSHAMIFGEKTGGISDFASYYMEMGDFFSCKNHSDQSTKCVNKALDILNSSEKLDHEQTIAKGRALFVKGSLQRGGNDLNGAVQTLAQSVKIFESLGGSEDASEFLIDLYELLANIHYQRRDQSQAHLYSVKGLDLIDKTLGLDNFRGDDLARELVCTLARQMRYEEAIVYAEKWENILKKEHGENDPTLVSCYFLHGQICLSLGNYTEALKKFLKIEEILQNNPNSKFHDIGEIFIEKARCNWNLGNPKEAKESFNQAIEYNKKRFGAESKKLADCIYLGAKTLRELPEFKEEAKDYYEKSLEVYRKVGSSCNFEMVSTIANFGHFLSEHFGPEETIKIVPEAIEICKRNDFPPNKKQEMLEGSHNVLGMAQLEIGDFENAIENLKAAAKICEETGNATGRLASHYFNLVLAHWNTKEYEKAQDDGKKILEMELEENGKGSQWINDTLSFLELIYSKLNQEQEFKELEAIYK